MGFKAIVGLKNGKPVSSNADTYHVGIDTNDREQAEESARLGFIAQHPEWADEEIIIELINTNPS